MLTSLIFRLAVPLRRGKRSQGARLILHPDVGVLHGHLDVGVPSELFGFGQRCA